MANKTLKFKSALFITAWGGAEIGLAVLSAGGRDIKRLLAGVTMLLPTTPKTYSRTLFAAIPSFVPGTKTFEEFAALLAMDIRVEIGRQCINEHHSTGVRLQTFNSCDEFPDLAIISPNKARASIEEKFAHVIEIAPLTCRAIKEQTHPEVRFPINQERPMAFTNGPTYILLCFLSMSRGVNMPILVQIQSRSLFGKWIAKDSCANTNILLGDARRP